MPTLLSNCINALAVAIAIVTAFIYKCIPKTLHPESNVNCAVLLCARLLPSTSSHHFKWNFPNTPFAWLPFRKYYCTKHFMAHSALLLTSTIITIIIIFEDHFIYGRRACTAYCVIVLLATNFTTNVMTTKKLKRVPNEWATENGRDGQRSIFDELSNELRQPKHQYDIQYNAAV